MKRSKKTMPWSMILKILDEVAWEVGLICPFLMQEPFLEPRMVPILRNIKQLNGNIKTVIFSNMSVMPDALMNEILDSRALDEIRVSFYAPDKETYERLQPPLKYEVTAGNIKRFIKLRNEKGLSKPSVQLHYIMMPGLAERYLDMYKQWRHIVDGIGFVHYDNWHGDQPDLERDEYWEKKPETERSPCPRLWNSMVILSDGTVVPCCIDYEALEPMGNIRDNALHEIWVNERFQAFRHLHLERRFNEIPLCRECTLWRYQHPPGWNERFEAE